LERQEEYLLAKRWREHSEAPGLGSHLWCRRHTPTAGHGNPLQAYQHQLRPGRMTLLNG